MAVYQILARIGQFSVVCYLYSEIRNKILEIDKGLYFYVYLMYFQIKVIQKIAMTSLKKIDKAVLRDTIRQYCAWNDQKKMDIIHNAGKRTSEEKWKEFMLILEFGRLIKPEISVLQRKQKIKMLNAYYEKMHLFEKRRAKRGQNIF